MNNRKTIFVALIAVVAAGTCMARPGGYHRHRAPVHHGHHHHHRHHSGWGRGGRNFWPGFLGGVAAGIVADSVINRPTTVITTTPVMVAPTPVVTPAPVVVAQPAPVVVTPAPVYQTQNVWVEGRYVDQVQPNGTMVRTWVPGHYEQRTVQVQ